MISMNLKASSVQFDNIVLVWRPFSKDLAVFPSWRHPLTYLVIFLVLWIVDGFLSTMMPFIHESKAGAGKIEIIWDCPGEASFVQFSSGLDTL